MNAKFAFKQLLAAAKDSISTDRVISSIYASFVKTFSVRKGKIFLEANKGVDFVGSPYYMAAHMLGDEAYQDFKIVVVAPRGKRRELRRQLDTRRMRVCGANTATYCYHLATAQFLINDATFPLYFSRRPGQAYLNTWHGTPLKAMGRHVNKHGILQLSNPQRNFLHATHLLCPNAHTESMFLKSYMIEKTWKGSVLRGGYPRNDVLINNVESLLPRDCYHLAFMPTWRGTVFSRAEESQQMALDLQVLLGRLDSDLPENMHVWVRLHPLATASVSLSDYRRIHAFPEGIEPYRVLAGCDALLTDYSSVMVDFASTGKPIILYTPDETGYGQERSFSLDFDDLPFPRIGDPDQLVLAISSLPARVGIAKEIGDFVEKYCAHDNGKSTASLCRHYVLGDQCLSEETIDRQSDKRNVLIFAGGFLNNGITTSLKNLIPLIDLEKCNITICIDAKVASDRSSSYFSDLNPHIDFIATKSWLSLSPFDTIKFLLKLLSKRQWRLDDEFLLGIFRQEARRTLGDAHFDIAIHFTGYDRKVAMLLAGMRVKKSVYMHNDMWREISSGRVFDPRSMRMALDSADIVPIVRAGVEQDYCRHISDISAKIFHVPNALSKSCIDRSLAPVEASLDRDNSEKTRARILAALDEENRFRFVNLGRFSPEKGHERLISAFEPVWKKCPEAQLFILGPHGVLLEETVRCAEVSVASSAIFVARGSANPFPLLSRMNAFVLSSFYEGLPLVLFESLALGVPIVATDIPGVREFLAGGYGRVVSNSTDGLTKGMADCIYSKQDTAPYDIDAHNRAAVARFHEMIERVLH